MRRQWGREQQQPRPDMVVAAAAATSDSAVVLENQENVDHGNRLAASGDPNASDISLTQEKLEDLILEAYTSMQSDGESIFLPEEVASKLHTMAELATIQEHTTASSQHDKAPTERLGDRIDLRLTAADIFVAIPDHDPQVPRSASPASSTSSRRSFSRQSFSSSPSASALSSRGRSPSAAVAMTAAARAKQDARTRDLRAYSYESRKEAAMKAKEDKALREQHLRAQVRQEREEARRKREEAQQRELEEKKQRVLRIKAQRRSARLVSR